MAGTRSQTVLSRATLSSVGMATQGLGRFAYTWAVGNFLGKDALGEVSALLSLAVYATLLWPAGLAVTAARYLALPDSAQRSVRYLRRSFALGATVIGLASIGVAYVLTADAVLALTTGLLVATYAGYTFTRGALLGQDRLTTAALWDTISSVLTLTVVVGVVVGAWHWALMLPLTVGYLVFTVVAWPRDAGASVSSALRGELTRYTVAASVAALATGGLLPATMVFVRAFDAGAAGYFGAALSLATPLNMLAQALNQVLVPHFTRLAEQSPEQLAGSHRRIFVLTSIVFVAGFGLLVVIAPWLITLFYPGYGAGASAMQALLVIVCAMSMMSAPGALLMADGRQRTYARIWLVATIVGTLTMVVAAPLAGQWGALLGFAVGGGGGSLGVILAGLAGWGHPSGASSP